MLQDDPLSSTVTFVPLAKVPSLSLAVVPLARRLTEVVVVAVNAKKANLDAIHHTVHEMAKDEARHRRGFKGLYDRYFGK